jgi:ATP-dependent Clp protease protease subunit
LYISSPGGSAYDGFAAVNEIITSKTPVHAVCSGYVMSMGLAIYVAAHKRIAFPYTNFMYHEVSGGAVGRNSEMERATTEGKRVQKMYDTVIISRTKIDQKKLDTVKKKSLDWFFGVEEAESMGFVDEIIR